MPGLFVVWSYCWRDSTPKRAPRRVRAQTHTTTIGHEGGWAGLLHDPGIGRAGARSHEFALVPWRPAIE
jgi:hypothetical protein